MMFDFLDRRSAERFAEFLDDQPGTHRNNAGELAELIAISHTLSAAPPKIHVDHEFRTGLRAMLLATAERDGIGSTATITSDELDVRRVARPSRVGGLSAGSARRIRARGAIVISVAAGAMAVSGISAASESAGPGDALYGVKRSTERAQLAVAGSALTRGQLSLNFARTRLTEAAAMTGDDPEFTGVLDDMDGDIRQGVKLLTGAAVSRKDTTPLRMVDDFVSSQRAILAPVVGKLGTRNAQRAAASIALLDTIRGRSQDLKAGLACDPVTLAGQDALGPKLAGCPDGKSQGSTSDRPQNGQRQASKTGGHGDPAASGKTRTTGKQAADSKAVTDPKAVGGRITPTTPAPSASQSANPTGSDQGLLGSTLGGVLSK